MNKLHEIDRRTVARTKIPGWTPDVCIHYDCHETTNLRMVDHPHRGARVLCSEHTHVHMDASMNWECFLDRSTSQWRHPNRDQQMRVTRCWRCQVWENPGYTCCPHCLMDYSDVAEVVR